MVPEKILYTDGNDVTVTDSSLKVKRELYKLNGIIDHWLNTVKPQRAPWIAACVVGVVLAVAGILTIFPEAWNIDLGASFLLINPFMVWFGAILILLSAVVLVVLKDRYAVRIAVAQGEKNVVVSKNKAYVAQIVVAMNQAFNIYQPYRYRESAFARVSDKPAYEVEATTYELEKKE